MEKKVIRVSEVILMLENGQNRTAIGDHYGLNKRELEYLFKHEKLKNRRPSKPKPELGIEVFDDMQEPDSAGSDITLDSASSNPLDVAPLEEDGFISSYPLTESESHDVSVDQDEPGEVLSDTEAEEVL